ncbi:LPXTG cell wall anchor domain-containing protein [Microbacterium sp. MC2]
MAAVPAVIIGAVLGVGLLTPAPATFAQPVDISFAQMLPGETRSAAQPVTIPVRARVVDSAWSIGGTNAEWTVTLCTGDACTGWDDLVGTTLSSGTHSLVTTVRMPDELEQGATAAASGSITFVEADAALPSTGNTIAAGVIGAGIAALVGGIIIILLARRRREDEEETRS